MYHVSCSYSYVKKELLFTSEKNLDLIHQKRYAYYLTIPKFTILFKKVNKYNTCEIHVGIYVRPKYVNNNKLEHF